MQRCPMCRVDNCYTELLQHRSETSLRALEQAWAEFYRKVTGSTDDKLEFVELVTKLCKKDHADQFGKWCNTMSAHMKHLGKHGIVIKRRATWRQSR